ncbi:unnamed protein product [Ixodes pacificus]
MSPGMQTAREAQAKITDFSNGTFLYVILKVTGLYLCGQYVLKYLIRLFPVYAAVPTSSSFAQFVKESKMWDLNFTFRSQIGQKLSQKLEGTPKKRKGLSRLILSAMVHTSLDFKTMQAEISWSISVHSLEIRGHHTV